MRRFLTSSGVAATVVVALWRSFAALSREHRRISRSGELGERLARRRAVVIERAVARERVRAPIKVPVLVDRDHRADGIASGRDDFRWLEGGMVDRTPVGPGRLGPVLMLLGVVGTVFPLVRPLGDASPGIALVSVVFVAVGAWRARSE